MRAVVLAAGTGSRLGRLTEQVPKCMVEVGGMPLLERTLRWLAAAGIDEVAVNLHHMPEAVTGYFGDGSGFGVDIRWSFEPELLDTAGTVASLRDWLSDATFLVVYGDNLYDVDLDELVAAHARCRGTATVALFERADVSASGVAEVAADGRVSRFIEKPLPGETASRSVNAGLLVLEPDTLASMPARGDLAREVLPALAEAGLLFAHHLGPNENLLWIDTPADLRRTLATVGGAA